MTKQIMFHLNYSFSKRIVVNVVCLNNKPLFYTVFLLLTLHKIVEIPIYDKVLSL